MFTIVRVNEPNVQIPTVTPVDDSWSDAVRRKSWHIGGGESLFHNTFDLCCIHTLYCILFMMFLSVYKVVKQFATTLANRKTPIPFTCIPQTIISLSQKRESRICNVPFVKNSSGNDMQPPQTICVPPATSYLQVGSLQSTVHVLLPRVRQLALLWTGHGAHTSADTQQAVSASRKSKTDWTHCWLPLCASRRLKGPRTAPNKASGVVPGYS